MITLFTLKWQKFLPFADGKNFAISNGKHFSYDRKNLFWLVWTLRGPVLQSFGCKDTYYLSFKRSKIYLFGAKSSRVWQCFENMLGYLKLLSLYIIIGKKTV